VHSISAPQLAHWLASTHPQDERRPLLLDVREDWEYGLCHINGSRSLPLAHLASHPDELDTIERDTPIVMICHHGQRSFQGGLWLERQGFTRVINLQGGIAAWALHIDPAMPTY